MKNLCIIQQYQQSKKTTHRMGENIYKLYINNRLILRIYREFLKLNNQKTNNPIKKWARDLSRHFSKEKIQMVNKYTKRRSMLLILWEMLIKTAVNARTPMRRATIRKTENSRWWRGGGDIGTLCTHGGNVKWEGVWKRVQWSFQQQQQRTLKQKGKGFATFKILQNWKRYICWVTKE